MTKNILLFIVFALIALCIALFSVYKPDYNWDILTYTASVYSLESQDTIGIHDNSYAVVKNSIPPQAFSNLISNNKYREEMYTCAKCFFEQLPFYKVRPLYIALIFLLYKLNVNIVISTVAVSAFSIFIIGIFIFLWLKRVTGNIWIVFIISVLLAMSPFLLDASSESSPKALSAMLIFAALFLFFKRKFIPFLGIMLLSVFSRPDNLLLLILFALPLYLYKGEEIKIKNFYLFASFILALIFFFLINKWSDNYSWGVWYEDTFRERITNPAEYTPHFNITFYLKSFLKWLGLFKFSFIGIQLILLFLTYIMSSVKIRDLRTNLDMLLLTAVAVSIFIHYVMYPVMDDKYFIAQYLFIDIMFMKTVLERYNLQQPAGIASGNKE